MKSLYVIYYYNRIKEDWELWGHDEPLNYWIEDNWASFDHTKIYHDMDLFFNDGGRTAAFVDVVYVHESWDVCKL